MKMKILISLFLFFRDLILAVNLYDLTTTHISIVLFTTRFLFKIFTVIYIYWLLA